MSIYHCIIYLLYMNNTNLLICCTDLLLPFRCPSCIVGHSSTHYGVLWLYNAHFSKCNWSWTHMDTQSNLHTQSHTMHTQSNLHTVHNIGLHTAQKNTFSFPQVPLSAVTRHTAHKYMMYAQDQPVCACTCVCLLWLMEWEKRRSSRNGRFDWIGSPCQRLDPWDVILLPFRLKQSITVSRPVVDLAPISTTLNREGGETFLKHNNYCFNLVLGHRRLSFS